MNAVTTTHQHKTNTFKWLLKREFWENRGGFLWAPLITGAIVCTLTAVLAVIALVQFHNSGASAEVEWGGMSDGMGEHARHVGGVGDMVLMTGISLTSLVLAFVVFFYALGCLYDDRRDRSVLFWKSLPASDLQTVLSKATWALLLAPALSIVLGILIGIVLWLIIFAAALAAGVPSATAIFTHSHPLSVVGNMLTSIPVYLFWAMPAVGWLMLCSAWARTKPFLWAVLIPLLTSVMITMAGMLPGTSIDYGKVWYTLVYRGLFSVLPGAWAPVSDAFKRNMVSAESTGVDGPADLIPLMNMSSLDVLALPDLWIGAGIGAVFIAMAVYLRRWRELAD